MRGRKKSLVPSKLPQQLPRLGGRMPRLGGRAPMAGLGRRMGGMDEEIPAPPKAGRVSKTANLKAPRVGTRKERGTTADIAMLRKTPFRD